MRRAFGTRAEPMVHIESWRHHFNTIHPHSSLNYLRPLEFKQQRRPIPT